MFVLYSIGSRGDVRGKGLFIGIELVRDRKSREPAPSYTVHIVERMKEEGVLIGMDGPNNNVLKIKPPLVFTRDNADLLLDTLEKILREEDSSCLSINKSHF